MRFVIRGVLRAAGLGSVGPSTQRDPIGLAGGINQYGYVGGDPVNYSDPFGLCKVQVGWTKTPAGFKTRHAFIEVTRADNTRVVYRGGPGKPSAGASSRNSGESASSEGSDSKESVAGNVTAETQSPDDPGSDSQSAVGYDKPLVDDKKSCAQLEASFATSLILVNASGTPYGLRQNSNSVVNTMLVRAGLGWLRTGERFAPGAESLLLPPF